MYTPSWIPVPKVRHRDVHRRVTHCSFPLWCFHTYLSILAVTLSACILLLSLIQNEVTSSLGPLWNRLWATKWGREQEAGKQGREGWERASLTRALSYLPSALRCKHWGFSCALWPLLLWHRPGMDILKGSSWSQFPSIELQVTVSELAQAQSGLSSWHVANLPGLVPHLLPFPVAESHTWVMTFFWLFCGSF